MSYIASSFGLVLSAVLKLAGSGDGASEQLPPLSVGEEPACHIVDARPLLAAWAYPKEVYNLSELNHTPLILLESLNASEEFQIRIEQRGCEDKYLKFSFIFNRRTSSKSGRSNLREAANGLRQLTLNSNAFFEKREILNIADVVERAGTGGDYKCFFRAGNECITDVSITYQAARLEIFYVDRP